MCSTVSIAVYGTLKKGLSNHNTYMKNALFMGKGKTFDSYRMIIENGIPFVFSKTSESGFNITVEVYKIDLPTLDDIDILEEHPNWYVRKQIPILLESKKIEIAWMYFNDTVNDSGIYLNNFVE